MGVEEENGIVHLQVVIESWPGGALQLPYSPPRYTFTSHTRSAESGDDTIPLTACTPYELKLRLLKLNTLEQVTPWKTSNLTWLYKITTHNLVLIHNQHQWNMATPTKGTQ